MAECVRGTDKQVQFATGAVMIHVNQATDAQIRRMKAS